jgi:hypothetical protein
MDGDARLLQQVHPAKLAIDISAELVAGGCCGASSWPWGPAAHFLPPMVASAAVLGWADVEALRQHPTGRYVLVYMSPAAEAVRLAGDAMLAHGAWRRRPAVVVAGLALSVWGGHTACSPQRPPRGSPNRAKLSGHGTEPVLTQRVVRAA